MRNLLNRHRVGENFKGKKTEVMTPRMYVCTGPMLSVKTLRYRTIFPAAAGEKRATIRWCNEYPCLTRDRSKLLVLFGCRQDSSFILRQLRRVCAVRYGKRISSFFFFNVQNAVRRSNDA